MLIRTSPTGFVADLGQSPLEAYLYDFDIDGDTLKSAHRDWLQSKVMARIASAGPASTGSPWWVVQLQGRASRSGSDEHNLGLSTRRAQAALQHLKGKFVSSKVLLVATGVGESKSIFADNTEFPIDRAVYVTMTSEPQPTPPPPPKPPPPKVTGTRKHFRLRVAGGKSGSISVPGPFKISAGIQEDTIIFEICDLQTKQTGHFIYIGSGKTLGWGPTFSGGVSFKGPPNDFATPADVTLQDFAGIATLSSRSISYVVNSSSKTTFNFGNPASKWSFRLRFGIKDLLTGRSIGAPGLGVAETQGEMKLLEITDGSF